MFSDLSDLFPKIVGLLLTLLLQPKLRNKVAPSLAAPFHPLTRSRAGECNSICSHFFPNSLVLSQVTDPDCSCAKGL
jgi:hypothetical protein